MNALSIFLSTSLDFSFFSDEGIPCPEELFSLPIGDCAFGGINIALVSGKAQDEFSI